LIGALATDCDAISRRRVDDGGNLPAQDIAPPAKVPLDFLTKPTDTR